MPEIQKELDGRYKDLSVQALGISYGDPEWYLIEFKEALGAKFPWLMMDVRLPNPYYRELYEQWELIESHPTLVLLDGDGIIQYRGQGLGSSEEGDIDYRYAFDMIGELLGVQTSSERLAVGQKAPDFTLLDADGNEHTLADHLGTAVVLEFWTWGCATCGDPVHIEDLKRIHREYPADKVTVLSIDAFPNPVVEEIQNYAQEQRIAYPILINGESAANDYGVVEMPVLFIIDQEGVVQYRKLTGVFDEEAEALLQKLLDESQEMGE